MKSRFFQVFLITLSLFATQSACERSANLNQPIGNVIGEMIIPPDDQASTDTTNSTTQPSANNPALPDKISLGVEHWAGAAPWLIADHRDIFRQHNVDPDLYFFTDSAQMHRSLQRNQVDLIAAPLTSAVQLKAQIPDLKLLYLLQKSQSADVLLSNDKIKGIKDLKGARVAYALDSPGMILLEQALKTRGLTRDQVSPVITGQDRALQLFLEGKVDAVVLRLPWLPSPGATDTTKPRLTFQPTLLFSGANLSEHLTYGLIASETKILSHKDAMRALVYSWHDAVNYIAEHPDDSIRILMQTWKISEEDARTAIDAVLNYRIQDNLLRYKRLTPSLLTLRLREAAEENEALKGLDADSMMTPIMLKKELEASPPPPPAVEKNSTQPQGDLFDNTYFHMNQVCQLNETQQKQLKLILSRQREELRLKSLEWKQSREMLMTRLEAHKQAEQHAEIAKTLEALSLIRREQKMMAVNHRQAALKLLNESQKKAWLAHELRSLINTGLKQQKISLSPTLRERLAKNIEALSEMALYPESEAERDKIIFRIRGWLSQELKKEKAKTE